MDFFGSATPVTFAVCELQTPQRLERPILFSEGEIQRRRKLQTGGEVREARSSRCLEPHGNQSLRLRIRQRLEQHAVDDTEDCGVSSDSYRESEYDRRGKSRRLPSRRQANFRSAAIDSTALNCHTSRLRCSTSATLPNSRRAVRSASLLGVPSPPTLRSAPQYAPRMEVERSSYRRRRENN